MAHVSELFPAPAQVHLAFWEASKMHKIACKGAALV